MVRKLTSRVYWESVHGNVAAATVPGRGRRFASALLGKGVVEMMRRPYSDYLIWETLFERHVAFTPGARILEIGSAPGEFLVRFAERFGYEPFGVEYSSEGVQANRALFERHGIAPDNVIQADFFADEFLRDNAGSYDLVVSRGFIEHFDDVRAVIERHVQLMRCGGQLYVGIPNFRGLNYLLLSAMNPGLVAMHNLSIMNRRSFAALFEGLGLETYYCGYLGTLNFNLVGGSIGAVRKVVMLVLGAAQLLANALMRLLLRDRGLETHFCSPYLVFYGTKTID